MEYESEERGAGESGGELPFALKHYRNARVAVHYHSGVSDTGVLAYLDRSWAELLKDSGERLLIPLQAIRILKLVKAAEASGDANLLRAADGYPPNTISTQEPSSTTTTTKQIGSK